MSPMQKLCGSSSSLSAIAREGEAFAGVWQALGGGACAAAYLPRQQQSQYTHENPAAQAAIGGYGEQQQSLKQGESTNPEPVQAATRR
ncbi:hypothetical protein HDU96_002602 [Phlyctochytrium bullatum]|nr:hypothetical protein HDU96_002602 [Phlyctochytrium bullatum]